MPTDVICPDCGGIIGATKTTAAGPPCTCVSIKPFNPSDDTVDEPPGFSPAPDSDSDTQTTVRTGKPKVCCNCGKDLTGHRRFKDSVGYWCKDCHRADKARTKEPETRCPDCGQMKPMNSLKEHDGRLICFSCLKEATVRDKREYNKRVSEAAHSKHEKMRLFILVGIVVVILLIIGLNKLGVI